MISRALTSASRSDPLEEFPEDIGAPVSGRAYPPLSSREIPVRLAVGTNTVWLIDAQGEIQTRCAPQELDMESRVGATERRVTFPDGTLFLTDHHAALEHLIGRRQRIAPAPGRKVPPAPDPYHCCLSGRRLGVVEIRAGRSGGAGGVDDAAALGCRH